MKQITRKIKSRQVAKAIRVWRSVLIALFAFIASINTVAQETLSTSDLLTGDIQHHQAPEALTTLLAGSEEISVRINQASVPLTRGVAIIVTDAQNGLFGSTGISAMTNQLNQWGWTTLVLPAPMLTLSSEVAESADAQVNALSASRQINEEAVTRYSLALSQRLDAAYNTVQNTPGYRLIVSHGLNAAGLIRLYSQGTLIDPDGLVVAGPFWPQTSLNRELPSQLAQTAFAVLDVTNEWDNRWSQQTQEQRRVMALTELKMLYRQRDIVGPEYNYQQYQYLAKEIYGWLSHLGW
jgi:hypothetical protein